MAQPIRIRPQWNPIKALALVDTARMKRVSGNTTVKPNLETWRPDAKALQKVFKNRTRAAKSRVAYSNVKKNPETRLVVTPETKKSVRPLDYSPAKPVPESTNDDFDD